MRLVARTIQLLEVLSGHPQGVGVTALSAELGEASSTVHRLLGALTDHGFVSREDGSRRYRLGPAVLRIGQAYQRQNDLVALATPHIRALSDRTMESVFLSQLVQDDVICVATAESPRMLSFYMRLGVRTPYHAASSARAILAWQPVARQVALMRRERLERFTVRTPMTVEGALDELERTRIRGYAICDQEMEAGITALSAPVRGMDGAVTASVTVVAPQDRLVEEKRAAFAGWLMWSAGSISGDLGYQGDRIDSGRPPRADLPAVVGAAS